MVRCMHFFVAMAVSTLSSDAILHIIPQLLEAHSHDHGHDCDHHHHHHHHHHNHNHNDSAPTSNDIEAHDDHSHEDHSEGLWTLNKERWMLLRLVAVMITIYVIYFVEFVAYYRKREERIKSETSSLKLTKSKIIQCTETLTNHAWEEHPTDPVNEELFTRTSNTGTDSGETSDDDSEFCCGLKSRALVILLGDSVHNLIDGIAIGASFHHSLHLGIITTIAVICHEVPHELGDLAVLLESGLPMRTALVLNFLSALTAYIGLIMSIIVGETKEVQMWLLAITAGMFIYVAWIDMLAHLKHDGSHKDHWLLACLIQYSGFTTGFVMIFALGWFEQNLVSS